MANEIMKKEAQACGAPYEKKGRVLVWHDEFDKGEIDYDKWELSRTMYTEMHEYDNSEKHARVENGQMLLQVHKSEKEGYNWSLSEGLNTLKTMAFRYGYVEMRAKIPYRHGAWPSFWCTSTPWLRKADWMCEIDIFEIFSSDRHVVANTHKWGLGTGKHCALPGGEGSLTRAYTFENYENLNDEYHIYALEWDKDFMKFYVDDTVFCTVPISGEKANYEPEVIDGIQGFHDPERLIINNEIFSDKSGWKPKDSALTDEDELPINYWIDYVRLYQDPATEDLYLKDDILKAKAEKEAESKK